MTLPIFRFIALVALLACLASPARAGAIIEGDTADAMVTQTAINNGAYDCTDSIQVGTLFPWLGADSSDMVEAFPLPYLAPGQQVTGATISFYLEQQNNTVTINGQLYGLNRVNTTSAAPLLTDWYEGTNDTANVLLDAKFVTPQSPVNQACTYSGSNLAGFIQKQYANAAFASVGPNAARYVFFRISPDGVQTNYGTDYQFASARNVNRAYHPTLALTISNGITNLAGRLQFSFSLPQASVTSAGVYNTSTGALIRTLWNNVQYQQGTNYGVWDGKNDSGTAMPTGSNYQIKMIYHNVQYVWEGTIGNTSANQSGANVHRYFGNILDMSISGGNAYYAVGYNELQDCFHSFAVGSPQVANQIQSPSSDPYSCINLLTSDATRSYWAKCAGGITPVDTYVIAINNSDGSFYTFPKGTVPTGANQRYPSCVDFDATANQANPPTGLAVQQTGSELFVSHANLNVVRVFDKVQGNLLGSFTVSNPGRLATTANGDVWVISNAATPVVLRYTFASGKATLKQTIKGLVNPAALGVSADDSLLLVADGGSSQQIKAFNNTTGAAAWTFGTLGGMAVNGPAINTNTFEFMTQVANYNRFNIQTFVAFQADNTFWLGDGGNGRALHFSINGGAPAYIEQIAFMAASYQSTVDLTDATRVFNQFTEYSVNYALPPAGTNGSWTMVRNWAYGLPSDSTHIYFGLGNGWNNVVTLSNGHTYGFLNNAATYNMDLYELSASGPARYAGSAFNTHPRIYADGTLRYSVTTSSTLSFYSEPLTGFDAQNNPKWGSPALIATTALAASDPKPWGAFPERTEITASGMLVNYDGYQGDTGYHLGGIPVGGTAWQWRVAPSTTSSYTGWFPQDGRFDIGNGVQYAGNLSMALGRNIVCGYHGEFWKQEEAGQWLNFFDNGLMVGLFGTPGAPQVDSVKTLNGFAGNDFAPTLVQAANGKTYLYCNDESNHGGTCRWRIDGWDGITELKATAAIGAIASLSPSTTGPTVSITSPTAGATFVSGNNITLGAQAGSSGASITAVQFFDGSTSLGTVTAAPFTLNYSGFSVGSHVLTAQATDSNGKTTTSASVSFTITGTVTGTPPPAPVSLSSGAVASQSVTLNWIEPTTTSAPTSYSIERAPGTSGSFAAVGTASGTALSFTDSNSLSAGTAYQYRIDAINGFGTSAYSGPISVTTSAATTPAPAPAPAPAPGLTSFSKFSSWQANYFTAAQRNDSTISGANADPYGSGVPNLLAYALQLNPATARPSDVPHAVMSNGHLTLTYLAPASITDITYIAEVSSDLLTWNSGAGYTLLVSTVASASGNTITVQDNLPATTQKHFIRLRVTQLP